MEHSYLNDIKTINGRLPETEILAQLAEECAELAQAALKLRRYLDGTNPTYKTERELYNNLCEEIADVSTEISLLYSGKLSSRIDMDLVDRIEKEKIERWVSRLRSR